MTVLETQSPLSITLENVNYSCITKTGTKFNFGDVA